jgi:hypothetical protein
MNRGIGLGIAALWLGGCDRPTPPVSTLTDAQIFSTLNERVGAQTCCFRVGEDAKGVSVYGPLDAERRIDFIVRNTVAGEDIACGWSGFPPAKAFNGKPMSSGTPTLFIVRGKRLLIEGDIPAEEFELWQRQLCGDAWVAPVRIAPIP